MLKVAPRETQGICVVDLEGQIDGSPRSGEFHEVIKEHLERGKKRFLINLEGVRWVNSLGVGVLIAAYISAKREEAVVKFCGPSDRVAKVLRMTGVTPDIFDVYPGESEGLESFE